MVLITIKRNTEEENDSLQKNIIKLIFQQKLIKPVLKH